MAILRSIKKIGGIVGLATTLYFGVNITSSCEDNLSNFEQEVYVEDNIEVKEEPKVWKTWSCYDDKDEDKFPIKSNPIYVEGYEPLCPDKTAVPPIHNGRVYFDCDDNNEKINPEIEEKCDKIDQNCNSEVDENITPRECKNKCGTGQEYCVDGKYQGCDAPLAQEEICNNKDEDCDGKIDESLTRKCENACQKEGLEKCIKGKWKNCDAPPVPEEICNNKDEDCDGKTDENLEEKCYTSCGEGKIICINGVYQQCDAPTVCCTSGETKDEVACPISAKVFLFVIDNSGSMNNSDPSNLRYTGIIEFVKKTSTEEESGLVAYSNSASLIGKVTNNQTEIISYINQAMSYGGGGGTNIPDAMTLAIAEIKQYSSEKIIILLTDGGSNVGYFYPEAIKGEAEAQKIRIYTMGLGANVNGASLNNLATGDGGYYFMDTAQDLSSIYNTIFNKSKYKSWKECNEDNKWIEKNGQCK